MPRGNSLLVAGQRIGKLVAVRQTTSGVDRKQRKWLCLCECGSEREFSERTLTSGRTSCGCTRTLLGRKFGKLTPIKHELRHGHGYICRCDCGTDKWVSTSNLVTCTRSCGCMIRKAKLHFTSATPTITPAYAAGFIDGDGSIFISVSGPQDRGIAMRTAPTVSAANTKPAVIAAFQKSFGGVVRFHRDGRSSSWAVSGSWSRHFPNDSFGWFSEIAKCLWLKAEQATLVERLVGMDTKDEIGRLAIANAMMEVNRRRGRDCPHAAVMTSDPYWAGMFDAEGSVGILQHSTAGYFRVSLSLHNNCRCILDGFVRRYGGAVRRGKGSSWRCEIKNTRAAEIMSVLLPYLIVKRERVEVALKFQNTRSSLLAERDHLRQKLRKLNEKGYKPAST